MQLENIQNKVREYLVSRDARSYIRKMPLYKKTVMEALKITLAYMPDYWLVDAKFIGLDEIQKARQNKTDEILRSMEKEFSVPRTLAWALAKRGLLSHQELLDELNKEFSNSDSHIKLYGKNLGDYEKSHKDLFKVVKANDAYVTRLALVAEREGFKKIKQKQTRYPIIRDLMPTKEEHIKFAKKRADELSGLNIELGGNFTRTYYEVFTQVEKETGLDGLLEKEFENLLKEIYGE